MGGKVELPKPVEAGESRRPRGWWRRRRDQLLMLVVRGAARSVGALTIEQVYRVGGWAGRIGAALPSKRRRRVADHLRRAFPEADDALRHKVLVESLQSAARMGLETMWLGRWNPERDNQRVTIETPELWQKTLDLVRERNTGLVMFLAHHGPTELLMRWFQDTTGMPMVAVAGRAKVPGLTEAMTAARESGGARVVLRGDAAITGIRHLRKQGVLAMLVDHNLAGEGVEVPFFGHPAHTLLAPARLALQSGAVSNTFFVTRGERPGTYFVRCGEPIVPEPFPRDHEARFRAEVELVRLYTHRIEQEIRENPGQYLWMHKRWAKRSDTLPLPS